MLYEEKVTSFADLDKRLRLLDQDAGIRLIGRSGKKEVIAFVTRFGPTYTMMTYRFKRGGSPAERLQTLEFDDHRRVEKELRKLAGGRLQAWTY